MGNRAVIACNEDGIGIYLHWNGGRDSVEAFLEYCRLKGYRDPIYDESYAFARLTQVIANYFGGTTSIGIGLCRNLDCDNYDNGLYLIGRGWKIVGRKYFDGEEQNYYKLKDMLKDIDEAQPTNEQLGKEFLEAEDVPVEDICLGDTVLKINDDGKLIKCKIIGFKKHYLSTKAFELEEYLYVNEYPGEMDNPNNCLRNQDVYKVIKKKGE